MVLRPLFVPVFLHEKLNHGVERVGVGELLKRIGQVALNRTPTGVHVGAREVDAFTGFSFSPRSTRLRQRGRLRRFSSLRLSPANSYHLGRARIAKASRHTTGLECRSSLLRIVSAFANLSRKHGPEKARISERPALTRDFRRVDSEPLSYHDIA